MEVREAQQTYKPELSARTIKALLRLSRALGCTLYETIDELLYFVSQSGNKQKICESCKDEKECLSCPFNSRNPPRSEISVLINGRYYYDFDK
jgi:hypothetical protein